MGDSSRWKVASSVGRVARTSGHHGCWVAGSFEDRKAMKKLESSTGRAAAVSGISKAGRIGILIVFKSFQDGLHFGEQ